MVCPLWAVDEACTRNRLSPNAQSKDSPAFNPFGTATSKYPTSVAPGNRVGWLSKYPLWLTCAFKELIENLDFGYFGCILTIFTCKKLFLKAALNYYEATRISKLAPRQGNCAIMILAAG
jgi:hypothetical protein